MRYSPAGPVLQRCADCSTEEDPEFPFEHPGNDVLVLDTDGHDRWHIERLAAADPSQESMF